MTQVEAIKQMISVSGIPATAVSEQMGYRSKSTLAQMMQRKNITVDALIEIADILGYKVTLQKKFKQDKTREPIDLEMDITKERVNHRGGREM